MRVTILGCGGSDGVPMLGGPDGRGDWGACDPANPKNRRTRASIHVEVGDVALLIDTAPDLRSQLLASGIAKVSHVAFTHDHADHTHGVNELRRLARLTRRRMPIYADADTIRILADEHRAGAFPGVIHCFTASRALAEHAVALGLYISFSGILTFKNARDIQETAKALPLERILVETDAPYLAPMPIRGKRNEPAFVAHTAAFLAKLRGETPERIAAATTENFFRLFRKVREPAEA